MQKLIFSLSISLLALVALFSSCKKDSYEDQFKGTWTTISVKSNGQEVSSVIAIELALQSDAKFVFTTKTTNPLNPTDIDTETDSGTWAADEVSKKLTLDSSNSTDIFMTIVSISETTLETSYSSGGANLELTLTR